MVENKERPGWLYEVEKGATTIWENWNGIDENGVPKDSLNHYSFGTVTGWFFNRVAGITPLEPGYKKVKIKPVPGGNWTFAECSYKSASGLVKTAWKRKNGNFKLDIEVPTPAEVHLPDGTEQVVEKGKHEFTCRLE
jgi:alpha-L-rhamnosidase